MIMDIIHAYPYLTSASITLINTCITAIVLLYDKHTQNIHKRHTVIYIALSCAQVLLACAFHMYWFDAVAASMAAYAQFQRFAACALMLIAITPAVGHTLYLNDYTQRYTSLILPRHTYNTPTQGPFDPQQYFGKIAQ